MVIKDFTFGPANYTTATGKEITWTNTDDSPHQIGIQNKNLKTGVLQKGQSEKLILDEPGTYNYNCTLHPGMKGTIEVK